MITRSAYQVAATFIGLTEIKGVKDNPLVMGMLQLDNPWPQSDEVPWCSAFMNFICRTLSLPRTRSLSALSWLQMGMTITKDELKVGEDIVILDEGGGSGHVGFFAGFLGADKVKILGGNQSNTVNIESFPLSKVAGYRRIAG